MRALVVALLALLALAPAAALGARSRARRSTTSRTRSCATRATCRSTSPSPTAPTRSAPRSAGSSRSGLTKQQILAELERTYGPGDPRQAAGQRLQPRGLVGAGRRRGRARSRCWPRCCRAGAGAGATGGDDRAARARPTLSARRRSGAWTRTSRGTTSDGPARGRPAPTRRSSPPSRSGFVSFISPCVLPLVPGYLSAVSGVSVTDIREGRAHASRTCSARRSSSACRSPSCSSRWA